MVNYRFGKIYQITSKANGLVYYGSTTAQLNHRLWGHEEDYMKYKEGRGSYVTSFDVLEGGDYSISLVESHPCEGKHQLQARERYYIENNTCVNKVVPGRTRFEYNEAHRQETREYSRKYHETHREQRAEYDRKRLEEKFDCPCGGHYSTKTKYRHERTKKHEQYLMTLPK